MVHVCVQFPLEIRGFGVKFYGLDALTDDNKQK